MSGDISPTHFPVAPRPWARSTVTMVVDETVSAEVTIPLGMGTLSAGHQLEELAGTRLRLHYHLVKKRLKASTDAGGTVSFDHHSSLGEEIYRSWGALYKVVMATCVLPEYCFESREGNRCVFSSYCCRTGCWPRRLTKFASNISPVTRKLPRYSECPRSVGVPPSLGLPPFNDFYHVHITWALDKEKREVAHPLAKKPPGTNPYAGVASLFKVIRIIGRQAWKTQSEVRTLHHQISNVSDASEPNHPSLEVSSKPHKALALCKHEKATVPADSRF
ncbi:hypothetical protein EDD16DRAFT_1526321 [Pisolithus croceorrhizus]|nr:hypothetical protein EDD16DRAFT_1526321 [Pisolithus croceorrhizus]KAI6107498.1 hypothetical protein EV401DRAFT_1892041 [Pisolithus croceorrhizus]